ncbi:Eaa1 [Raoultella ornithinolytica]|nr:Eaa1 [Raoultella ornithinolytica]
MTTDITELAQREKFEAWWEREYKHLKSSKYTDAVPHIKYGFWMAYQAGGAELVEAVEKAQGMETYWKTQCRGITDHCEELQARIAELESNTVKPPVHPTVASEKLDDETLQELIEFRRTTFEYHSKEGNKVQTIIHGVTLAALRELQERRKADSEPVATLDVQSRRPDGNKFALVFSSAAHKLPDDVYFLYRHAQPAPALVGEPVEKKVACWSCQNEVEISAIGDCDGYCPNCNSPIHLDEEPYTAPQSAPDRDQVRSEHAEWSQATFGNVGPIGPLKHLSKEALEAAAEPGDLSEWADMQFLLWDAQRRAGITDDQITQAMIEKLAVNKQREWPDPKDGEPRLHIKEQPVPVVPTFEEWCKRTDQKPQGWVRDAMKEAYDGAAVAMLQAGNSPVIPDGYVMVPKEPTEAMMLHKSGCQHHAWNDPDCAMRQTRQLVWSLMIAAATQEVK